MICDTLGSKKTVAKNTFADFHLEWASNFQMISDTLGNKKTVTKRIGTIGHPQFEFWDPDR